MAVGGLFYDRQISVVFQGVFEGTDSNRKSNMKPFVYYIFIRNPAIRTRITTISFLTTGWPKIQGHTFPNACTVLV